MKRDHAGRFVKMEVAAEPAKTVTPNLYLRAKLTNSLSGCGNCTLFGMAVTDYKIDPHSTPWNLIPAELPLSEVMETLRKKVSNKEISLTFARYHKQSGGAAPFDNDGYSVRFKAHEFMEILENHPNAKRVSDWLNTNHNPPTHLRSYVILFDDHAKVTETMVNVK